MLLILVEGLTNGTSYTFTITSVIGGSIGLLASVVEEVAQEEVNVKVDDDKTLRQSTIIRERLMHREKQRVNKLLQEVPLEYSKDITIKSHDVTSIVVEKLPPSESTRSEIYAFPFEAFNIVSAANFEFKSPQPKIGSGPILVPSSVAV